MKVFKKRKINIYKEMKKNMLLDLINSNTNKLHLANKYLGKY